jgi:hypothetical protein
MSAMTASIRLRALLVPALVAASMGCPADDYHDAIIDSDSSSTTTAGLMPWRSETGEDMARA